MPVNSAFLGLGIIIFYIIIYYITNTNSYFTSRNFDLSAIPIVFIYLVNGALFVGLFSLLKKKVFSGNPLIKGIMAVIAILGIAVVLLGTMLSPNGLVYLVISIGFLGIGLLFKK